MDKFTCCICGKECVGYGNNPEPIQPYDFGKCCDACNRDVVMPKRIELLTASDCSLEFLCLTNL